MAMEYLDHEYYNSDDALSFSDLPVFDKDDTELDPFLDSYRQRRSSTNHDRDHDHDFEFFVSPEILSDHKTIVPGEEKDDQGMIFFGVPISPKAEPINSDTNALKIANNNSRHNRSGRFAKRSEQSPQLKKCQTSSRSCDGVVSNRASSFRFGSGAKRPNNNYNHNYLPANGSSRCRGGGEGSYRKHNKVIMGLVRFQAAPKMELSEMRRRQSRRNPVPMFPVGDGSGEPGGAVVGGRSHWALFRPLRCRAHFVSAWTKASFRCL